MLLRLDHVKKDYPDFNLDCSITLKEGTITGIIGQNGAGKSTMFKTILGLIHINDGDIEIFGKKISDLDSTDRANIGSVFANTGFNKHFTVKEVISIMDASYQAFDRQDFIKKCESFSIPLNKKIDKLSTGMHAKLKLLLAISYDAKLLILDEPTVGLDVTAREELLDTLRGFMTEEKGILISSHIASDLEQLCDEIYMIHDGKIVLHEDTDVLLSEYGILKLTEEQYETVDKIYILKTKKSSFGYRCLTNQKQFYMENYPDIVIEKGSIDDTISLMTAKGGALL